MNDGVVCNMDCYAIWIIALKLRKFLLSYIVKYFKNNHKSKINCFI